jgi:hypothetical protein
VTRGQEMAKRRPKNFHTPTAVLAMAFLSGAAMAQDRVEALEAQVESLQERLDELESSDTNLLQTEPVPRAEDAMAPTEAGNLSQAIPGTERLLSEAREAQQPAIEIGGALRFNAVYRDFVDSSQGRYGESGLDVFRLNVDGQIDNILISAEYRFYSYMHTIHHGWIGYEFDDTSQIQLGIHQVPFGLLPYASHNAWFGVPYYVGLADNYDMGIKYIRRDGKWTGHLAFYKNEELNDATNLGRYSFDLVRVDEQQNEEVNRVNARLAYTFGLETDCETELGGSAQVAQVYNAVTDARGDHWAGAAHSDTRCGRWNFQLQAARYEYSPANPESVGNDSVQVGAFQASYPIASRANIAVANVAYNIDSPWRGVDQIICYNNYSRLLKRSVQGRDSQINTVGCAIGSGPLFTYVDWIRANNMPFFGEGSMATGGDDQWHNRFNINLGFYW